ncbi:MAG: aspartate kinase [Bacteroidetes bacterium]|nr:aspartate kinase [Bacteroidota bacterium]
MMIMKFGGTSVGSAERIKAVAKLTASYEEPKMVVLSAMSGTTNSLLEIADFLAKKNTDAAQDKINLLEKQYQLVADELLSAGEYREMSYNLLREHFSYIRSFTLDLFTANEIKCLVAQGELLSTALFELYCHESGIEAFLLPALNFMRIDREQEPDHFYIKENLQRELEKYPGKSFFITQGFICRNAFGEIDNLKRGGSDYSAALIGVAMNASAIQIWTDIDGFHDNDPRFVKDTHAIAELSFDEAAELAYFGAKILHPSTILPAKVGGIPVIIKNTLDPQAEGTTITDKASGKGIKAIAAKDGITAIRVKSGRMLLAYGFMRKVFEIFEIYKTPIDMITTSEISVSLTIDDTSRLSRIIDDLKHYGTVETDHDQTIISAVGEGIAEGSNAAQSVFNALSGIPVRMISYGGSQHNISILIPSSFKSQALNALSAHLFNH